MHKHTLNIIIMESSKIIHEGLQAILYQSDIDCRISKSETLDDLTEMLDVTNAEILIANTMQLVNREKEIKKIQKTHPNLSIIGIDFGMTTKQLLSLLDSTFTIFDSVDHIIATLYNIEKKNQENTSKTNNDDNLTDREIDVLTKLVGGFSNKEIAESLNISVHTVITHRKNITMKTGIRSQSGLTIYAISKKIVLLEDLKPPS